MIVATKDATSWVPVIFAARTALAATAAKSRTRSGRDLAARPEDGVEDRPGGGGIEAVLYRDPRDRGVAQVLWDDERSDRDSGDEIASQPTTIVGANPSDHGHVSPSVRWPTALPVRAINPGRYIPEMSLAEKVLRPGMCDHQELADARARG